MPRFVFISDAYRKRFGSRTVLDHVSFSVHECEVLGLIGPKMPEKQRSLNALPDSHAKHGERRFRDRPVPSSRRKEALFYLPDAIRPWLRHRRRRACESADRPPALQQTNRRDTDRRCLATRPYQTRRFVNWLPWARPRTRFRHLQTQTRRGSSSCQCASFSE